MFICFDFKNPRPMIKGWMPARKSKGLPLTKNAAFQELPGSTSQSYTSVFFVPKQIYKCLQVLKMILYPKKDLPRIIVYRYKNKKCTVAGPFKLQNCANVQPPSNQQRLPFSTSRLEKYTCTVCPWCYLVPLGQPDR